MTIKWQKNKRLPDFPTTVY